ncbi:hypothetical protein [Clostridium estertheticum]|nr:hypothetical protein [Clostridium estertheticum]
MDNIFNDKGNIFYIMPGGVQYREELLTDILKRKCADNELITAITNFLDL